MDGASQPTTGEKVGNVTYYRDLLQGTEEWLQARCGLLTASEMKKILTPTLKAASNEKERAHLFELLAQRINRYVEPSYIGDDMLRGHADEMDACLLYAKHHAPLQNIGFMTNDKWGFTLGYSPDGLVGSHGLVECKSRAQKFQVQTILEHVVDAGGLTIPVDYVMQLQTGLLVSERQWIDFISYSGGMPFVVIRQYPDPVIGDAIINVAGEFEFRLQKRLREYMGATKDMIPTERKIYEDIQA